MSNGCGLKSQEHRLYGLAFTSWLIRSEANLKDFMLTHIRYRDKVRVTIQKPSIYMVKTKTIYFSQVYHTSTEMVFGMYADTNKNCYEL